MQDERADLLQEVAEYYTSKLTEHGATARGVDWNDEHSQEMRFTQLCKVVDTTKPFSANDLGCGYGALYQFLRERFELLSYTGIDLSEDMVLAGTQRYTQERLARFLVAAEPDQVADYGFASGVFNVRQERSVEEWRKYVKDTLDILYRTSRFGFSFNCLTSYSDNEKMRDDLFYCDPCAVFDLCKRRYSRNVALLHDYGLYEFTILVRK